MDLGLDGKTAVVCAASGGLGKAGAMALAQAGARVVICSRDEARIKAAAAEIIRKAETTKDNVLPVTSDLSKGDEIDALLKAAVQTFGQVDILVTNSGGPPSGGFHDLSDEQWQTGFERNLMSVIRSIRGVIPAMQKNGWGRIINITSLTVKQPVNDLIVSSVLRPGILGLSKILANLYARDGITVNSIAPGFIMTGRQQELGKIRSEKQGITFDEYVQNASADIPAGRFGTPEELASVIAFLASEKASYINGATIGVDGGLVKGLF
ncbi:MAG: SDR family oxidoreductase [Ignavibacteria bacterium]|nr:SDR family oxidoreductase [Ignavibacteria bacterium]